jgi:hypothetical protein
VYNSGGTTTDIWHNAFVDSAGNPKYKATAAASFYRLSGGQHLWYNAASGTAGATASFTQAMTLNASGQLGIGQTNPTATLHLKAGGNPVITLDGATTSGFIDFTDTRLQLHGGGGAVYFVAGNAERARITSGGYFKASNDATYQDSAGAYHEFRTDSGTQSTAVFTNKNASTPNGIYMLFPAGSPDNNTQYFALFGDSTTTRCVIYSDGDVLNHDGVYGTISDERLKQDIVDAGSQWDDIKAIRFRKYRMKTDVEANPDAPAMLGVVAQELEQVSPGLVDEHPDFEEREVTDEDGNVTTEKVQVGTTKTVKSSILLMKAAVALQEAMARIEALEARLAVLEA